MKQKQWFALALGFALIGLMFVTIDSRYTKFYNSAMDVNIELLKLGINNPINLADVWIVINSEIYEPFIYLSLALCIVFTILGFMEKKDE